MHAALRAFRQTVSLIVAGILFGSADSGPSDFATSPGVRPQFSIEAVIWQLGRDYPNAAGGDDSALPINAVHLKTHDGTEWMSVYDDHPNAISGPGALRNAIATYEAQGIETIGWFVPKGTDIDTQLRMAQQVIDAGVAALYADIEVYEGFCHADCAYLAREFWPRLRSSRPDAELGVIYDPRPRHRGRVGLYDWLRGADTALPMCYWADFVNQPPWNDPAGCVKQAEADLRVSTSLVTPAYVPMLQGAAPADEVQQALTATKAVGASRVSIWRRGVVSADVWAAIADYRIAADSE